MEVTESVETTQEFVEDGDQGGVKRWCIELDLAEKDQEPWRKRAQKIVKRYKDESPSGEEEKKGGATLNIFWSNVETLKPALYSRTPKVQVERRFKDADPVGRLASTVLERSTAFCVDSYDFDRVMEAARDDYLIPGRGVARVRYVPTTEERTEKVYLETKRQALYRDGKKLTSKEALEAKGDEQGWYLESPYDEVVYEEALCDYIYWEDFLHSPARVWEEVRWVGFRSFMTRDELVRRFGDVGKKVKLDQIPKGFDEKTDYGVSHEFFKKAVVWEIWDKDSKTVYWISKGFKEGYLDKKDDPLRLKNFFPCTRPLLATTTSDSLVPVPDYCIVQDLLTEIDELTIKIGALVETIKVTGMYNPAVGEMGKLIEGDANKLYPARDWASYAQSGGIKGNVDFVPIDQNVNALQTLYEAREKAKQDLYEVTGISDIVRGFTQASETATAQQIKGQFATLRLSDRQRHIQKFARDLIALKAEIIAEHFQPQTIALMAGLEELSQQEPGALQMFDAAVELLRNDALRSFRIDIETDSTIAIDEDLEKQARTEFLNALGPFLNQSLQFMQSYPQLANSMGQVLLFTMRGFRVGRSVETAIEEDFAALQESIQAQLEAPPGPDPEQQKLEMEAQKLQLQAQSEAQKLQLKEMEAQFNAQLKVQEAATQAQIDQQKLAADIELKRTRLDLETALKAQEIRAEQAQALYEFSNQEQVKTMEQLRREQPQNSGVSIYMDELLAKDGKGADGKAASRAEQIGQVLQQLVNLQAAALVPKEREITIVRGPDGRAIGGRSVEKPAVQ